MKKLSFLIAIILCAAALFAQAPEKFTYQAVVRNTDNSLVTSSMVGVRVSILQGSATGNDVYVETQMPSTNTNGLITLNIGEGNVVFGSFDIIDWSTGPFFLKTEIDPTGGLDYTITSVQQLLSVPYALYATEAGNGFSGDYNDLTNTPQIPGEANNAILTIQRNDSTVGTFTANASENVIINVTVPTAISQLDNDAGFVTAGQCDNVDICELMATVSTLQQQLEQVELRMDSMASLIAAMQIFPPTVTTAPISDVTTSSASCGGIITNDGGSDVIAYGICWSTSINPTIADSHTMNGSGIDSFASAIMNLAAGVTYYVRAYATNSVGTGYGENVSFIASTSPCGNNTVTDHEGNIYNTVQIGSQCWTKENMRCTTSPSTGTTIVDANPTGSSYVGKKAYYVNGDSSNTDIYGLLYNWNAALDTFNTSFGEIVTESDPNNAVNVVFSDNRRGICPEGWHIPNDAEWTQLSDYVYDHSQYHCPGCSGNYQSEYVPCIAKSLASTTGWVNTIVTSSCDVLFSPSTSNNATGFNAVPAGYYTNNFGAYKQNAYFMCATQINVKYTPVRALFGFDEEGAIERLPGKDSKNVGMSVRCLRDGGVYSWDSNSIGEVPVVTTTAVVLGAEGSTVTGGGNVDSFGNGVTAVGVCWNTTGFPTLSDSHTNDGYGVGSFTSILTNLEDCATYYVRAYAINGTGTSYGEEISFTTGNGLPCGIPTVTTSTATNITTTTATCGGTVASSGETAVTARGVCWSTSMNPTISDNHTTDSIGIGNYVSHIGGLTSGTTYYIRAYATNSAGTAYGNHISFTTPPFPCCSGTVTDHEGNVYNTVRIGEQCWTKENMRCTTSPNTGTVILEPNPNNCSSAGKKAYYVHGDSTLASTFGLLYNWNATVDTFNTAFGETSNETDPTNAVYAIFDGNRRGICPIGWHVPSDEDWTRLTNYIRGKSQYLCPGCSGASVNPDYIMCIAKALASATGWSNNNPGECTVNSMPTENNSTGFNALAADYYEGGSNNTWNNSSIGYTAFFQSATQNNTRLCYYRTISYNTNYVYRGMQNPGYGKGMSVRCLRDGDTGYWGSSNQDVLPSVKTSVAVNVTDTSALSGGVVEVDGGSPVIARGLCWSTVPNPTLSDSHSIEGNGVGVFVSQINGLTPSTKYYLRAYAINAAGTAYGGQIIVITREAQPQFTCGTSMVVDHEGNAYHTLQIGSQCWTKENMRCKTSPSTGTIILEVEPIEEDASYTGKKAYYTGDRPRNTEKYGLLYNWNAAMDVYNEAFGEISINGDDTNAVNIIFNGYRRGICPQGWHIPSTAEWQQLTNYVSSQSQFICGSNSTYIAKALAASGWNSGGTDSCGLDVNQNANNVTEFSIVPADEYPYNNCNFFGCHAHLWCSTQFEDWSINHAESNANILSLYHGSPEIYYEFCRKNRGLSVRCLRD